MDWQKANVGQLYWSTDLKKKKTQKKTQYAFNKGESVVQKMICLTARLL